MNKYLADIANRRLVLLETIEAQRMTLAEISQQWQKPLAIADVGVNAVHYIRHHPALVTGVVTAFVAWRRNGIVGLAQKGWRMLFLYPSALSFGWNIISSAVRSPSNKPK
jgi:hypothetical protein